MKAKVTVARNHDYTADCKTVKYLRLEIDHLNLDSIIYLYLDEWEEGFLESDFATAYSSKLPPRLHCFVGYPDPSEVLLQFSKEIAIALHNFYAKESNEKPNRCRN